MHRDGNKKNDRNDPAIPYAQGASQSPSQGKVTVRTGDQNIFWDAVPKAVAIRHHGPEVRHYVHTADWFSDQRSSCSSRPLVTRECHDPDGNLNRWTACLEAVPFLGCMSISPQNYKAYGISFAEIARGVDSSESEVCHELTEGDWLGMVLPRNEVAESVKVGAFSQAFNQLRRPMRDDLRRLFGEQPLPNDHPAIIEFDRLTEITRDLERLWPEAAAEKLRDMLARRKVDGVTVSTTVDQRPELPWSKLFALFVEHYPLAFKAYNEAVHAGQQGQRLLEDGELPFYAVIQTPSPYGATRVDLYYRSGDTPNTIVHRAVTELEKKRERLSNRPRVLIPQSYHLVSVMGKALLFLSEQREYGHFVLPERGSDYSPVSHDFVRRFRAALHAEEQPAFSLNDLYRIRLHALDALQGVDRKIRLRLPWYLREYYGRDFLSARELGSTWRQAVDHANSDLEKYYRETTFEKDLHTLVARGDVTRVMSTMFFTLDRRLQSIAQQVQREPVNQRRPAIREHHAVKTLERMRELACASILHQKAKRVRTLLARRSLSYWNCRPFYTWIIAIPEWMEQICGRSEFVVDADGAL